MKKNIYFLIVVLFGMSILIMSCEKSEPEVTSSDRDKYIGTWDGQSDGSGGHRNFPLIITISNSAPDQIKMENFDGGNGIVFATVSGNSLSIPSQVVSSETIQGTGNHLGVSLSFSFTVYDGQVSENRTGIANNKH